MMVAVFFQPEQATVVGHLQPWLVEAAPLEFWRRANYLMLSFPSLFLISRSYCTFIRLGALP
jgi:hypothetical protein